MSTIRIYNKDGTIEEIPTPEGYTGWFEPESPANEKVQPVYPYNNIQQTESGHSFEMDDTPTRERVRIQHRSGTFIEMHPDGTEVHKVYGDGYEITIKDKNVSIQGNCNIVINGDCNVNVKGDKLETIEGDYSLRVLGNYNVSSEQSFRQTSVGDMRVTAGTGPLGGLSLSVPRNLYLAGDLTVQGQVTAKMITSLGRVDAVGVRAGAQGFVTATGGLSVGWPGPVGAYAVPGMIIAGTYWAVPTPPSPGDPTKLVPPGAPGLGTMNAVVVNSLVGNIAVENSVTVNAVTLNSGVGNFFFADCIWMTDITNTIIYDMHTHPLTGKGGGTGPTTTPMT